MAPAIGLQLAEIGIAVAQLHLHGEAGGVADALDRRRRITRIRASGIADIFSFSPTNSDRRSWPGPRALHSFRIR